jgi:SPP1 family predicted phage head-tail adaptor
MEAGKLDRKITIQGFTNTVNEFRAPVKTWTDKATVWAQLIQRSTREAIREQGAQDEALVIFRTRHLAGVTNADRVLFEGRTLNIKEVTTIGRRVGLELRCNEVSGDG